MKSRVVITGMGVVSPIGNDVASFWSALMSGKSGAGPITLFDPEAFPTKFACEVKNFASSGVIDAKEARRMERFTQFGLVAARCVVPDVHPLARAIEAAHAELLGLTIKHDERAAPQRGQASLPPGGLGKTRR